MRVSHLCAIGLVAAACDGGPAPVDASAPMDAFTPVLVGACRSDDYRPRASCEDVALPEPILSMSFEGTLAVGGTRNGGIDGFVTGSEPTYVPGPRGVAMRLAADGEVMLNGSAERLRNAPALTFALWIREPEGPARFKSYLHCRSQRHGFSTYRGVMGMATCAGARNELWGPAGCAYPWAACDDRRWHHLVVRYDGGVLLTIFLDGQVASSVELVDAPEGSLFASAAPLALGAPPGTGPMEGPLDVDELRVWDRALDPREILLAGCP